MDNRRFYRCQTGAVIFYYISVWFMGLLVLGLIAGLGYFFYDFLYLHSESGTLSFDDKLIMLVIWFFLTAFNLGMFINLLTETGVKRKILYKKFERLSDAEQAQINAELGTKFRQLLWGEKRLYIQNSLVEFVDYKDIAWIYRCNTMLPMIMATDDSMTSVSQINSAGVHIYDSEGTRYKIKNLQYNPEYSADEIIKRIKSLSPNVVVGFSKERLKSVKKNRKPARQRYEE